MTFLCYVPKNFSKDHSLLIKQAIGIINEYEAQGFNLTLRQLYYQFVSRDIIPNNDRSYKKLGNIISDARRAGLISWLSIVDRTRFLRHVRFWDSTSDIMKETALQYDVDWWKGQGTRVEVWVEKDALIGVIEAACEPLHCPYFSCRGYVSDSEIWSAAQRVIANYQEGYSTLLIHLGDHDPSGIDMSRDIEERIRLFSDFGDDLLEVKRIALTMAQVNEQKPPPNPAKVTDKRFKSYKEKYGTKSWELDALKPTYIAEIIRDAVKPYINEKEWKKSEAARDAGRKELSVIAEELANPKPKKKVVKKKPVKKVIKKKETKRAKGRKNPR